MYIPKAYFFHHIYLQKHAHTTPTKKEHGSPLPLDECHPKLGVYQSSLHAAVLYGNVELVKTLLDACHRFFDP
jgi:hypothetical protein